MKKNLYSNVTQFFCAPIYSTVTDFYSFIISKRFEFEVKDTAVPLCSYRLAGASHVAGAFFLTSYFKYRFMFLYLTLFGIV